MILNEDMSLTKQDNQVFINQFHDFNLIWGAIESCDTRGIYYYNENDQKMEYSSFTEIYKMAGKLAGILKEKGITKGDKVMACSKTSLKLVYLWLAHIWIGAVIVPMPPKEALFGKDSFRNRISNILPNFKYYICEDNEKTEIQDTCREILVEINFITYSELFQEMEDSNIKIPYRETPGNDDLAFIQYTSGSTNRPKGVMIRFQNLFANLNDLWKRTDLNPKTSKLASWLPLYHDMGLVGYFLGALLTQTELILESSMQFAKRPLQFLSFIGKYKIEVCSMPNFAIEWILRRYDPDQSYDFDLSSLKWIGIGAEPINLKNLEEFESAFSRYRLRKGVVSPCYGLAEATLAVSIEKPLESYKKFKMNNFEYPTAGTLLDSVQVKIEKHKAKDAYGVIKIKGTNVAKEALIDGRMTSLLDKDGYYNTKDIGLFLDGKLIVLGRSDDMFIINGENFFPYEVESAVKSLKFVSRNRVVCFNIPASQSESGKAELIVLYEIRKLSEVDTEAMNSEINHAIFQNTGLKADKIIGVNPKTIQVTSSGKIQRNLMRTKYLEGITLLTEQIGQDILSI